MGVFSLLSALLLGGVVVRRMPFPLYRFEAAAFGVVLGFFLWIWVALLLSLVLPYDIVVPIVITASLVAAVVLWPGRTLQWRPLEGGKQSWWIWGAATGLITVMLARLFWTHSLPQDDQGVWSAGASWADYGVHAALINHFNAFASLPTDLPLASGEKLTYPFLIDLLSAFYAQGGMSLHASMFWPGLLLAIAVCQLIISVGLRLFGRISVGIGGLVLALFIGSAAGTWAAWGDWRDSGQGLFTFLGKLPQDYSAVGDSNANVTNFLVDALLPQRSILFGFGVGLIVLTFLMVSREREAPRLLWPAAVLVGLLPMAHPHTFMVTFGYFLFLAAEAAWRARALPWQFLRPIGLTLLLAAPQLAWQQLANGGGTGGRFRFGWMVQEGQSVFPYWWANFGLIGIALLVIPFVMRKHPKVIWFLPMLVVLFITQIYAFQPFEYDNLKLIYWVYVMGGLFIAYLAGALVRRHIAWLALIVPLSIFVMAPGALAITREFQLHDQFASPDDVALADWVAKNTPPESVFASSDRPNNPVATLAGRTVVMGYRGWLYNFSIPYNQREAGIRAAFQGQPMNADLQKFDPDYLLVAANEDPSWSVNEQAIAQYPLQWSNTTWRVYKLP